MRTNAPKLTTHTGCQLVSGVHHRLDLRVSIATSLLFVVSCSRFSAQVPCIFPLLSLTGDTLLLEMLKRTTYRVCGRSRTLRSDSLPLWSKDGTMEASPRIGFWSWMSCIVAPSFEEPAQSSDGLDDEFTQVRACMPPVLDHRYSRRSHCSDCSLHLAISA